MSTSDAIAAVSNLDEKTDDELFAELGGRLRALGFEPGIGGEFSPTITVSAEALGPLDDLRAFGPRFFDRLNREAYNLVCGSDPADSEDREKVKQSLGMGPEMVAATLTTALIAHLGLAPVLAPVYALLIVRLIINPAGGAMCDVWKTKLGPEPKTQPGA